MTKHWLSWATVLLFVGLPACGPAVDACGEGTSEQNGVCVADAPTDTRCGEGTFQNPETFECEPLVACGTGTVFVDGACLPEAECGAGTYLDLATNTCLPDVSCGPGTYVDPETQVCLPVRSCGAGTTFNPATDDCEADFPCAAGATLNPDTNLCESFLACGPGQILLDGLCVGPNQGVALGADFVESIPDNNDPFFGGVPEEIVLDEDGETVATGIIGRPADIAGNGTLTQDRDVWRFEGQGGTLLRIEVLSLGLPAPVFVLNGPGGYERRSSVGYEAEANRQVMLPKDGPYELTVVPSAFLSSGVPLGSPESGYVIRISEQAIPSIPNYLPGVDYLDPTDVEFNLKNLSDNFFNIQAFTGAAVLLLFDNITTETLPSVLVFNADWELISERQVIDNGDFVGVQVKGLNQANVVLDWRESTGPADDVKVRMHVVPLVNRGAVNSDASSSTNPIDIAGLSAGAFRITTADRQVILADVYGTGLFNPDVQVIGPGGTRALVLDDDEFFFLADPGEYIFFVHNDQTSDDEQVGLVMTLQTPYDLGQLNPPENTTGSVAGDDLVVGFDGFERAFLVVEAAVPSLLGLDVRSGAGDPDLSVYSVDGALLRRVRRPNLDRPVYTINNDSRPLLIELDADDQALVDWSVTATVQNVPVFLDIEPNDARQNATLIPNIPAQARGLIDDDEIDVYEFDLLEPLEPGQSLRVHFDNTLSDNDFSFITDGAVVRLFDENFLPLASIPDPSSSPGTLGVNTATYIASYEGTGTYYVEIEGKYINEESPYILSIDIVDLPVEVEPNDDAFNADPLGPLPASAVGYREVGGGDDVFSFDLVEALGPSESVWLTARNFENNNNIVVTLKDALGTELGQHNRKLTVLQVSDLPAGSYTATVGGYSGGEFVYQLDVAIGPAVEVETNDLVTEADDMGLVAADAPTEVYGYSTPDDDDIWLFNLAEPLAADQSLRVSVINLDDSSRNIVELHGEDPALGNRIAVDDAATAFLLDALPEGVTGPYTLKVLGTSFNGTPDRYRVQVSVGGPAEREPNDAQGTATPFSLPGFVEGMVRPGDVDVYAVTLDGTEDYRVQMQNESDGSNIRLTLRDDNFAELTTGMGFRVTISVEPDGPATYYLEVTQEGATSDVSDTYSLDAWVQP